MPALAYASIEFGKILLDFDIGSKEMDPTCIIRKGFTDAIFIPMLPMFISIVPFVLANIVQNTFFNEQCYSLSMRKYHSFASVAILSLVFFALFYVYLFVLVLLFNCTQLDAVFGSNGGELRFDPGAYLISVLYMCLACVSISLIVVFVPKSFLTQTIVASLLYSLSILFSGNVIPIYMLKSNIFLSIISYIDPFRYTTAFTTMATFTSTGSINLLNSNPGGI
ncbi:hypothetical protein FACS1894166_11900 [Bacilli bacterium]|nr:hypothetical protein FACS1894166_11900 [Bacilli bacterium]